MQERSEEEQRGRDNLVLFVVMGSGFALAIIVAVITVALINRGA